MRGLFVMMVTTVLIGCSTFTLSTNVPKTEDSKSTNKTINASFVKNEPFINACIDEQGQPAGQLSEIRYQTNPLYWLASLLTLGLYVPQNVTWWCTTPAAECADGDTSDECEVYVPEAP
jgi:hypothetical protein